MRDECTIPEIRINVDRVMYSAPAPVAEYIDELRNALQGWMFDHGDRCRICMARSQDVIKRAHLVEPTPKD